MPSPILTKSAPYSAQAGSSVPAGQNDLNELIRTADAFARSRTPEDMRKAIKANAELGQTLKNLDQAAVPCFHEQIAHRFGIALSRALALREDAPTHAQNLLDATGHEQKLIELDGVMVPRGDIEEIARGLMPMTETERTAWNTRHAAMEATWANLAQGWGAHVHLGGFLSQGAWVLHELRSRNVGPIPSLEDARAGIVGKFKDDTAVKAGLKWALDLKEGKVVEGGLDTDIDEVVRQVWAYCSRHSEATVRDSLIDAFATRLRDIASEKPCNTGCVQRLLQTVEGIDPDFEPSEPDLQSVQDEMAGMVAVLHGALDAQIEADQQARAAPGVLEQIIPFKQALMQASLEKSLIDQRRLPSGLVAKAIPKALDDVEFNELMLADKGYADLDIGYRNYRGVTALMRAVQRDDTDAVRAQLKKGAGVNDTDALGRTALMIAAQEGKTAALEALLAAKGIAVNQASTNGKTALMIAALNGHADAVEKLLAAEGIEVNKADKLGGTALMMAALNGHADAVEKLLAAKGIAVNQAYWDGWTALMIAAQNGHADAVEKLLAAKGIAVNKADKFGRTALMMAAENGHADAVEKLLAAKGIAVNQVNQAYWGGWTALMIAAENGHADAVEKLLAAKGIAVNQASTNGKTALMMAAQNGHADAVEKLLAAEGILPRLRDHLGFTARRLARRNNHPAVIELLGPFYNSPLEKFVALFHSIKQAISKQKKT